MMIELNTSLPKVPRLYLYSTSDTLVFPSDVEGHGKEAADKGVQVYKERFEGTPHVGHARDPTNAARYWKAVDTLWKRSA
jgi:hypothetical protein